MDAIFGSCSPWRSRADGPLADNTIPGFSFSGEVREPFSAVIQALEETNVPVTSVDAPSSWSIEDGPPASGVGSKFNPAVLVSLTAPKPLVKHFKGRHFIGGRLARCHQRSFPSCESTVITDLFCPREIDLSRQRLQRSTTLKSLSTRGSTNASRLATANRNSELNASVGGGSASAGWVVWESSEPFRRWTVPTPSTSYNGTAPSAAVWADWAWAQSFVHVNRINKQPPRAPQQGRMVVETEPHID